MYSPITYFLFPITLTSTEGLREGLHSSLKDSTLLTSSLAFGLLAMFKIYHGYHRCDGFFLSRIFIVCCWIYMRLPGAMIITDYLLLEAIQRRTGANIIRNKSSVKWQHKIEWNPWKIKSVASGVIRELLSACALSWRRRSKSCCLVVALSVENEEWELDFSFSEEWKVKSEEWKVKSEKSRWRNYKVIGNRI